jgi:hypothetical protein
VRKHFEEKEEQLQPLYDGLMSIERHRLQQGKRTEENTFEPDYWAEGGRTG